MAVIGTFINTYFLEENQIVQQYCDTTKDKLIPAILQALNSVTPSDCQSWFTCTGYWIPFRRLL